MSASGNTRDGPPALLRDLPHPAHNAMFADIGIKDTKSVAMVDRGLRDLASLYVKTLEAKAAGLPAKAWQRFKRADGLRLTLFPTPAMLQEFEQILRDVPDRLKRLIIEVDNWWAQDTSRVLELLLQRAQGPSSESGSTVEDTCARATSSSDEAGSTAAAGSELALEQLQLNACITPADAARLLQALSSSLQDVMLSVRFSSKQPMLQLPPCSRLRKLHLILNTPVKPGLLGQLATHLDLSALSAAQLEEFEINCARRLGLIGLSGLKDRPLMKRLCLYVYGGLTDAQWPEVLQGMPLLEELTAPHSDCSSEVWQAFAQLEQLRQVELGRVELSAGLRPLAALQVLTVHNALELVGATAQQRKGLLVTLLPALQQLSCEWLKDLVALLGGLSGHAVLWRPPRGTGAAVGAADAAFARPAGLLDPPGVAPPPSLPQPSVLAAASNPGAPAPQFQRPDPLKGAVRQEVRLLSLRTSSIQADSSEAKQQAQAAQEQASAASAKVQALDGQMSVLTEAISKLQTGHQQLHGRQDRLDTRMGSMEQGLKRTAAQVEQIKANYHALFPGSASPGLGLASPAPPHDTPQQRAQQLACDTPPQAASQAPGSSRGQAAAAQQLSAPPPASALPPPGQASRRPAAGPRSLPASSNNDFVGQVRELLKGFSKGEEGEDMAPELLPLVHLLGWTSEALLGMLYKCSLNKTQSFDTSRFESTINSTADITTDEAMLCFMVGDPGMYYCSALAAGLDEDVLRAEVHKEVKQRKEARARSRLRLQQQAAP